MKTGELIHLLSHNPDKSVYVKIEGGLFYPILDVKTFDDNVIIVCKDIVVSAESSGFELPEFKTSAKKKEK